MVKKNSTRERDVEREMVKSSGRRKKPGQGGGA